MTTTGTPSSVGELTVLLASWRLHLEAANLSPRTIRAYTDDCAIFARFLRDRGMPTAVAGIRREHVEAFMAAELERTAPSSAAMRYRSLQQLFRGLDDEGEIDSLAGRLQAARLDRANLLAAIRAALAAYADGETTRCPASVTS